MQDQEREIVAAVQHTIWSHWMKYLFSVCTNNADGSVTIPADKVERWSRQMSTEYKDLTHEERESGRHQADKVLKGLLNRSAYRLEELIAVLQERRQQIQKDS
jgi:hypothetical protein